MNELGLDLVTIVITPRYLSKKKCAFQHSFHLPLVESFISYLRKLVRNRAMFVQCRYGYWKNHKSSIRSDKNNLSWQHFHPKQKKINFFHLAHFGTKIRPLNILKVMVKLPQKSKHIVSFPAVKCIR